ncbi:MAG: VTT domain-containing protein [Rhodospirillales bacterium]|nr:VTT domain-containing protein [Rhodospirillales bacterium]MDE2577079.1 VTT domain-containing protein [Rhodospirillales bacterium]
MAASVAALLVAAGKSQLVQGVAIALGTFVLEDAATVLAAMRVQEGAVAMPVALLALYFGVALGDVGLYGLGMLARRLPWAARLVPEARAAAGQAWLRGRVFKLVLASRFLPGTRLPAYTACGFLRASFREFALAAVLATLVWTTLLFGVSLRVGQFLIDHLGAWRWAGAGGFAIALILVGRLATTHRVRRHDA